MLRDVRGKTCGVRRKTADVRRITRHVRRKTQVVRRFPSELRHFVTFDLPQIKRKKAAGAHASRFFYAARQQGGYRAAGGAVGTELSVSFL